MLLVFPSTVRIQILAQHLELRELIDRTLAEMTASMRREELDRGQIGRFAREVHGRFKEHLAFEEKALAPVLWVVDGWGPERVQDMRKEHARQRRELDTLIDGLNSGWDAERLARELRRLAADLLTDMDQEENGCLRESLLHDGVLDYERR
jgi:hypothetical protein